MEEMLGTNSMSPDVASTLMNFTTTLYQECSNVEENAQRSRQYPDSDDNNDKIDYSNINLSPPTRS